MLKTSNRDEQSGLAAVFGIGDAISIDGEIIELTPLRLGEIPRVMRLLREISVTDDQDGMPDILALLSGPCADTALDIVALTSRKPREWIDNLAADEGAMLILKVIEVNSDFFAHRVLPVVTAAIEQISQRLAGPTPSCGLPEPAGHLKVRPRSQ